MYYKLDENKNVLSSNLEEWFNFMQGKATESKYVAKDKLKGKIISTIFLGISHGWNNKNLPLLFETMIFNAGSARDIYMERYATWKEAEEGHQRAIEWVKREFKDD